MAFVAPIFFMVILGIVEFGRAFMVAQLITNSARDGARKSCVSGSSNSTVTASINTFLQSTGIDPADVTITITVDNANAANEVANAVAGDECSVTVLVPFDKVSYVNGSFLNGKNLVGKCVMRHE